MAATVPMSSASSFVPTDESVASEYESSQEINGVASGCDEDSDVPEVFEFEQHNHCSDDGPAGTGAGMGCRKQICFIFYVFFVYCSFLQKICRLRRLK